MATKTNCEKNGKKYYRVTASLGRDSTGKLIRKEFYGKSKKEAEAKKTEYLNGLNNGLSIDHTNITLGQLMHSWLFEIVRISSKIKPSTFERYEGIYRNYVKDSEIYGLKLSTLKSMQIQRYYTKLYDSGKSSNVINNLNKLLRSFFNFAVSQGYMVRNLCGNKSITIPGEVTIKNRIDIFTDEEIKRFKIALEGHRMRCIMLITLGTGLRLGELLGLKWSNVDLENREICVKEAIKRVNIIEADGSKEYKLLTQTPKSKDGFRTVPIPSSLINMFELQLLVQEKDKLKVGESYNEANYVFTTSSGNNIESRNLAKTYKRILLKAKIPYRKFHTLRHTYASKLFEKDVPLKTVQTLLGHADIITTANTYTHLIPKQKSTAVEKLNDLFE